jgi:pyruvate dehydrogenase E2 component (dihydrolipoamide acetyltransferase)
VDITMPQLGETVTEGTVTRWLKQIGDQVAPDELIFEVSTDKVDSEVPAPGGGYLVEILVPEGETVPVGTRLAVLGDAPPGEGGGGGGDTETAEAEAPAEAKQEAAKQEAEAPAAEASDAKPEPEPEPEPEQEPETVQAVEKVPETAEDGGGETGGSEADEPGGARKEAAAASAEAEEKGVPTGAAAAGGAPSGAPGEPAEEAAAPGPESGKDSRYRRGRAGDPQRRPRLHRPAGRRHPEAGRNHVRTVGTRRCCAVRPGAQRRSGSGGRPGNRSGAAGRRRRGRPV